MVIQGGQQASIPRIQRLMQRLVPCREGPGHIRIQAVAPLIIAARITSYNVCYTKLLRAASLLLGIKGHYRLQPLTADAAQAQLSAWLAAWLQGLTEPLPLLWATCFVSQDEKAQADLFAARERQFVGSDYLRGDSSYNFV